MASASVFLQASCYDHQYIRSKDTSSIVERPERLRAVTIGLASTLSRLAGPLSSTKEEDSDLVKAFERININSTRAQGLRVVHSTAVAQLLNHPAIKFVHGDIDGDKYLENLLSWVKDSRTKIANGQSEIPDGLSQGDLYLCPGSVDAIQGALGTICQAVDSVLNPQEPGRAFVAIRPPGHHCGEDTPSGFCFVNNVCVAAAHAHLQHNINRVVILDIDLHHGNGTQSIAWQINEETYRQTLESEGGAPSTKLGPKVYYGSLHDILSYPCEDGKLALIQAASVSIHGNHGQYIENVHLEEYTSEDHFWQDLYPNQYNRILKKAKDFLDSTGGPGEDVMIFISCGFDACEHEYTSMSRHNRKVPIGFYRRFTQDVREFSNKYAHGRVLSVLEGGYSDRALISGTMAHLCGLVGDVADVDEGWWSPESLDEIEKATKKKRGGRTSLSAPSAPWLAAVLEQFAALEAEIPKLTRNPRPSVPVAASTRQLRDRKPPAQASQTSSKASRDTKNATTTAESPAEDSGSSDESSLTSIESAPEDTLPAKKGPRVILRLGPKP
ncbi:hypothetical protein ONZ45_g2281 [Pleurotus djamor]|nr:hypothetical protein ONZ45_g2281 [Pleurotus djamor]